MLKLQVDASLQLNYSMIFPPRLLQKGNRVFSFDAGRFC